MCGRCFCWGDLAKLHLVFACLAAVTERYASKQ
jgi:hypothetical protein